MNNSVLVSGSFNILHAGHVELLKFAAQYGSVTVALNADWYLKEKYGDKAVPLQHRALVMRACRYVDKVIMFREPEPSALIRRYRPNYYVRGPDYAGVELPEMQAIEESGTTLVIHRALKISSSSQLLGVNKKQDWTWGFD